MTQRLHDHARRSRPNVTDRATAIAVALALDATLREPPLVVHPVRWIGRYLQKSGHYLPSTPARHAFVAGSLAWAVGAGLALGAGAVIERLAPRGARRPFVLGIALWPLVALRMLTDEVEGVERALETDLDTARAAVARIVSRDVRSLDEPQIRQAAIESLAENLSDSVVAPLFWFAVGGLPAAAAYRFANTADAVWGYRNARWEYAGKVAAHADDALNFVPSRLTARYLSGTRVRWRDVRREAVCTPSPNAGWPMAAMALRLGIRLSKPGVYTLNPAGRSPTSRDTARALRLAPDHFASHGNPQCR